MSFQSSSWSDIESLRTRIMGETPVAVEDAAQAFAQDLARTYAAVVLARVFVVLPLGELPEAERRFATSLVGDDPALGARTPTLALLGTAGRNAEWSDRKLSKGHRAIPLLGAAFVQGIPMIAKLLADLDVGLAGLDDGRTLDTRRLAGGRNGAFFVPDARSTNDGEGRAVIPNKAFVETHDVRTVFGMGGAYVDGTLTVALVFTSETIDRLVVDRFPSLISNFKMATSALLTRGRSSGKSPRASPGPDACRPERRRARG